MLADQTPSGLPARVPWRTLAIPPACGLLAAVLVTLIGRAAGWQYRREMAMALFFLVSVLLSGLRDGKLKSHPLFFLSLAAVSSMIGVAIVHWS